MSPDFPAWQVSIATVLCGVVALLFQKTMAGQEARAKDLTETFNGRLDGIADQLEKLLDAINRYGKTAERMNAVRLLEMSTQPNINEKAKRVMGELLSDSNKSIDDYDQ